VYKTISLYTIVNISQAKHSKHVQYIHMHSATSFKVVTSGLGLLKIPMECRFLIQFLQVKCPFGRPTNSIK